jgi:hypothetical protein
MHSFASSIGLYMATTLREYSSSVRRSRREETEIIYRNLLVPASSFGALCHFHLGIVLEQFKGRIEAATYEQASHYPFPESFVAPAGLALGRLRYAKRVYEKTAR